MREIFNNQEAIYRFIDYIDIPICLKDVNDRYELCNQSFCNLLELNKNEIIGKSLSDFSNIFSSSYINLQEKQNETLLKFASTKEFEIDLNLPNAGLKRFLVTKKSILEKDKIVGILIYMFDITSIKDKQKYIDFQKKELDNQCYKDEIVDIYNNVLFWDIFDKQIKLANRYQKILILSILQIDMFTEYSAIYGEFYKNKLLNDITAILKGNLLRPDDYIFKMENGKFAMLSFVDMVDNSLRIHKRIELDIKLLNIKHKASKNKKVCASVGVGIIRDIQSNVLKEDIYNIVNKRCTDAVKSDKKIQIEYI